MKENSIGLGFLVKVIDRLSRERIIYIGLLIISCITVFVHLAVSIPLEQKVEEGKGLKTSLEQEIQRLESEQKEWSKSYLPASALPEALSDLQERFGAKKLVVEEILINHSSSESGSSQAVIKATVVGERPVIFEAVRESLVSSKYPFVFQELDILKNRAVIQLIIPLTI